MKADDELGQRIREWILEKGKASNDKVNHTIPEDESVENYSKNNNGTSLSSKADVNLLRSGKVGMASNNDDLYDF